MRVRNLLVGPLWIATFGCSGSDEMGVADARFIEKWADAAPDPDADHPDAGTTTRPDGGSKVPRPDAGPECIDTPCSCDAVTATPLDCNPDGDGLPPVSCTGPSPTSADDVLCVCADAPCGDAYCDSSYTSIEDALAAANHILRPTFVILYSGSYEGAWITNSGTAPTTPLVIAARCSGGTRDAVTIASTLNVDSPYVRLEGFAVYMDGFGSAINLDPNADYAVLRQLTISGTAPALDYGARYVNCAGSGTNPVESPLLEEVDIFGGDPTTLRYGGDFRHCPFTTIRRSSACRINMSRSGFAWKFSTGSGGSLVENTLARETDTGFWIDVGSTEAVTLDGVEASLAMSAGVRVQSSLGTVVRNSRFTRNTTGLWLKKSARESDVFNNLFEANAEYGLHAGPADVIKLRVSRISFNTFVENGKYGLFADGSATGYRVEIDQFGGNLFVGHDSPKAAAVRAEYATATSPGENVYHDNSFGSAKNCSCIGHLCTTADECLEGGTGTDADPLFTSATDGFPYCLGQPPGQSTKSPGVDREKDPATEACSGTFCLSDGTTSTTGIRDTANADIGYHRPACN